MPRFYFDFTDSVTTVDDVGTEFPNAHAAREAAVRTLPDLARDAIGTRDSRIVSVQMGDELGRYLFTASLNLSARWLVETA